MTNSSVALSIVVPLYNEEQSVQPLCTRILDVVELTGHRFEVILVDDGSTDRTFQQALHIAERDRRFRIIKLSRNFGQTAALYAGFDYARGDIVVTMDGDLQNDPRDISRLVEKIEDGYDIVLGYRADRKDRFLNRKLPSRIANWLIRKVADTEIIDNGCALRAYRSEIIKKFPLYSEMHRLLPTILALTGVRMTQIRVQHHPRKFGTSKYGLARVYKVLFDLLALMMVLTAVKWPLFGFGTLALVFGCLGMVTFIVGVGQAVLAPGTPIIVPIGATALLWVLALSLLMLGTLGTLIYARADLRMDDLLSVESR